MRNRITLNTFRRLGVAEEVMLRGSMPRTSAADPDPLPLFAAPEVGEVVMVARRDGSRLMRTAGWKLAEVAHA